MISLEANSEAETSIIGTDIAMALQAGDIVFLAGDLGAGKTTLARAIIRAICGSEVLEVPSPTFTICQSYDSRFPIQHCDLYRLSGSDEIEELGLEDPYEDGLLLVEWPDNCFAEDPEPAVRISIASGPNDARRFEISGNCNVLSRIGRSLTIRKFLTESELGDTDRKFLSGDASTRAYELVDRGSKVLMNAPEMPDGPPIKDGKAYSQIAHLAENVSAFVAVDGFLRMVGINAPRIFASDLKHGLLLIENLGTDGIVDNERKPIRERYLAATELLHHLHAQVIDREVPVTKEKIHHIPDYDRDAMMTEAELLLDWFVPEFTQSEIDRTGFLLIWGKLISLLSDRPKSLVLRDFHSPNILWIGEATEIKRVGVIDFQDALIGPTSYDLASVAQDARVDIPEQLEAELVDHYVSMSRKSTPEFDETLFREEYAIMAAQRATKILGIFVRLDLRDGKPQYRVHIPRILNYLKRTLRHPVMEEYHNWLSNVVKL